MGLLSDHRVVVTGVGDIGGVVAATIAEHGADVEVWDRDQDALDALGMAGRCVDVTDADAVAAAINDCFSTDTLTGLVTSAGVLSMAPVVDLDPVDWRRVIDVNLTGTFLCCQAGARRMLSEESPAVGRSIVTFSSIGGLRGEPDIAHYSASKFGVIGFTQSLARELGPSGIRVNSVCPGAVDSRMNTEIIEVYATDEGVDPGEVEQTIVDSTPLGRLSTPDDVAGTVVYLLSDLAKFVTSEAIAITGGLVF
ncbi:MAG: SDR family oxidoreductase [Acidimicrobiaceae bacterium]|nr:SDR family oxidoreductase [Acidimicrobiaceae bacterium]